MTDDNFLSLMGDDGSTKDDVKVPEGDVGDKIEKLFRTDEKDTSMTLPLVFEVSPTDQRRCHHSHLHG